MKFCGWTRESAWGSRAASAPGPSGPGRFPGPNCSRARPRRRGDRVHRRATRARQPRRPPRRSSSSRRCPASAPRGPRRWSSSRAQLADSLPDVRPQSAEQPPAARRRDLGHPRLAQRRQVARRPVGVKFLEHQTGGLLARRAAGDQLLAAIVEMLRELFEISASRAGDSRRPVKRSRRSVVQSPSTPVGRP